MSFSYYSSEEFANDPHFRQWVLTPDPASNYFWEKWLLAHPYKKEIIHEARVLVIALKEKNAATTQDQDRVWSRVESTIEALEEKISDGGGTKVLPLHKDFQPFRPELTERKQFPFKKWLSVAAITIGTIALSFFIYEKELFTGKKIQTEEFIVKEVPKGQKLEIHLPDGSIVVLNSLTRIKYPRQFNTKQRVVELSGEAFFEVKKDSLCPFIVQCYGVETKVLGTSFNVKAYPDDKQMSVSLVTGKVLITSLNDNHKVTLIPGEQADVDVKSGKMLKGKINDKNELAWKDGVLAFNDMPLNEVFKKLELWYGVNIQIENGLPSKKVTGVFEKEYLGNVLQSIQFTIPFEYRMKGDSVYINIKDELPMK